MRRARSVAVSTATATDLAAPKRSLALEPAAESPRRQSPTPPPKPRAAERIVEALQRWLEEDM